MVKESSVKTQTQVKVRKIDGTRLSIIISVGQRSYGLLQVNTDYKETVLRDTSSVS